MNRKLLILPFSAFFILAAATDTFPLDQWSPPVLYGGRPLIFQNRIYIPDRSDEKIKVYDIKSGFKDPLALWQTPGPGLGPGEIQKGSRINNLAIDASNGALWVSHRLGFTVFDKDGNFKKTIKSANNSSWLVVKDQMIFMTSPDPLTHRKLLTAVKIGQKQPLWHVDYPHGIPVNEEGGFINEKMELYHFGKTFFTFNPTIGELIAVDHSGDIAFITQVTQNLTKKVQVADRMERFIHGEAFTLTSLPNPYSGAALSDGKLMILKMHQCAGIVMEDDRRIDIMPGQEKALKTIVAFDVRTGEKLGEYFNEVGLFWIYLLGVHNEKLTFFNAETGDRIYQIDENELKRFKRLIF